VTDDDSRAPAAGPASTPEVADAPTTEATPVLTGRSGRNVPVATAVGAGLGGIALVALLIAPAVFAVLAAIVVVLACWELSTALAPVGVRVPLPPLLVGGVATVFAAYVAGSDGLVAAFALTAAAIVGWRGVEPHDGFVRDAAAGVFCAAYVPLLMGFGMLMLAEDDGPARVAATLALVACSDTGGFLAGVAFGKHKLAPRVSPGKTWEGAAGSVVLAAAVGAGLVPLFLDVPWWGGLLLGLAVVVTATVGDLGESLIKRDLGIKDMSHIVPGHGGVLDRIDSHLATLPVAAGILALLLT
jgi:phosphatidate cytidylyltransferase